MNEPRNLVKLWPRQPAGRRYDRNCVLAAVAGQIIAASELGLTVLEVVVGDSPFDVGKVAYDIKLQTPAVDRATAIVAKAGEVGFCQAAGMAAEDIVGGYVGTEQLVAIEAAALLQPWIMDGRYARLVQALDSYQFSGRRTLQ